MHVGAVPVFADIDDHSFCISVRTVEKLITKKQSVLFQCIFMDTIQILKI